MTSAVAGEIKVVKDYIEGDDFQYILNEPSRHNEGFKKLNNHKKKLLDLQKSNIDDADRNKINEFLPFLDEAISKLKPDEHVKKVGGRKAYRKRKNTRRTKSRRVYTSKRR